MNRKVSSSRFSGALEAPSRDRHTEVRERSARVRSGVSGRHQRGDVIARGSRGCLSQRIVVGRARAPLRGAEGGRVGKGRSTCENSLIQPRIVHARRLRRLVYWGIPNSHGTHTGRVILYSNRADSPSLVINGGPPQMRRAGSRSSARAVIRIRAGAAPHPRR
jgi:hypothetical protein